MPTQHQISVTLTAKATQFESELKKSQSALKQLEGTVAGLQQRMRQTAPATSQATSSLRAMTTASSGLASQLTVVAAGYLSVQGAVRGTQAVFAAGMNVERQERAWAAIAGGTKQASEELAFLRATADRVGVSFLSLEEGYRNVAASAKGTALEGDAMRKVFLAITEAGQQLGLSSESVKGALVAISQMASTGTVQLDELRQQLGNHIPGVMTIAAKAMNMTTAEFRKQVEAGNVLAEEFLPRFARAIRSQFVPSMETAEQGTRTLSQEIARVGNVLTEMTAKVAQDSGLLDWTKKILKGIADIGIEALKTRDRLQQMQEREATRQIERATEGSSLDPGLTKKASEDLQRLNRQIDETAQHIQKLETDIKGGWGANLAPLKKIHADLVAEREKLLQTLRDMPKPSVTLNPTALEAPDMGAFTEQSNRQKRATTELEGIIKATEELAQTWRDLKTPAEIVKDQLDFLTKELEKFNTKYKDLVQAPTLPSIPQATVGAGAGHPGPRTSEADTIRALIRTEALYQKVDPNLAIALATQESNLNPNRPGDNGASLGVFQLQRKAAIDAGIDPDRRGELLLNIHGGVRYLAQKLAQSGGNVDEALTRYNTGGPVYMGRGDPNYVRNVRQYLPTTGSATPATVMQPIASTPSATTLLQPALALRDQLQGSTDEQTRIGAIQDMRAKATDQYADAIARLVEQFKTGTTAEDVATRTTELANIARQAAAGDADGLRESLVRLDESLGLSTVSMNANERAIASRTLESLLAVSADEDTTKTIMDQVKAYKADAEAIEETKRHSDAMEKVQRGLAEANETLLRVDEQRADAIGDILATMQDGLPTIEAYEAALRKLQGLGPGEGATRLAQSYKERSTAEFQAIQDGAANLSASLEDTLIASLTRGGDAWKQFGQIAVEELLRIVLQATQFRQTLTELLTKAGQALIGIIGGLGTSYGAGAGGDLRGYGGPTGRATGGPLLAGQRSLVGEQGQELLVSRNRLHLVGQHGPEIIRPTAPAYVLNNRDTMTLLRTSKPALQPLAARATGGSMVTGGAYLAGEEGMEAVIGMQGSTKGKMARGGDRPIVVNMHLHGVADKQSFVRSQAEVKRAAALAFADAQRSL